MAGHINSRKRPDLVVPPDRPVSVVGTEALDQRSQLTRLQNVLVIELKRGGEAIGRDAINQSSGYVEDFLICGAIEGMPYFHAFVVGHLVDDRLQPARRVGEPEVGRTEACTYAQLVRTAGRRLFRLRDTLHERYADEPSDELLKRVLDRPVQRVLEFGP